VKNIFIREAKESDLPAIENLALQLIESMESKEGIDLQGIYKNFRNLLKDSNSHILVAEVNGTVVGFISFAIHRTLLHIGLSGLIDELIVDKKHRGKGIGKTTSICGY